MKSNGILAASVCIVAFSSCVFNLKDDVLPENEDSASKAGYNKAFEKDQSRNTYKSNRQKKLEKSELDSMERLINKQKGLPDTGSPEYHGEKNNLYE